MPVKIQLRRDTSANWSSRNPILAVGEPGFETDTNKLKLGDGVSAWNDLIYLTPDFINIVSSGGIADLTLSQQNDIVEGTIVLTSDGVRWIYTGSGSKTLEASYVQLADISPAWIQITSKPASLVGLADILTTASGDFIIASGNNVYQVVNFAESVDDRIGNGLFVAGTGINLNYNDAGNSFTVSVTGLINNPTNNRILTSRDTTTTGINAESNLTFDGNTLSIPTSGSISSQYIYTNNLRQIGDDSSLSIQYDFGINITSLDPNSAINLDVDSITASINSNGLTINSDVTANYFYGELDGSIVLPCKNNTVSTINIGTPVYISGHFANGKVYVEPADASNSAKMPAVGLLGSTLTSGSEGHVHVFGSLKLDTTGLGYTDPTDVGKTLYVASGGGLTLTRPTGETDLVQNIARLARIHNNGKYIILGPGRSNDVPNSITAYKLDIDNIRIDGNTLSSTDTNGNIVLSANGSGDVQIDADTLRVGDANATATITSNGTGNLVLNTNGGVNSGSVTIAQGTNGNITIEPNGSGDVYISADTLRVGDGNATATVTSNGTEDLVLNTNSGTNSGSVKIAQGTNGNITIEPNGSGDVYINADTLRVGDGNATATITSNGAGNLVLNTNSGTNSGSVTIDQGSNGNITIEPNGSGDVYVNADTLRIGDSNSNTTLTTNGTGDLILNTNSGSNSGSITIEDGSNNDIIIAPNGAGQIILGKQNSASDPQELSYANGRFSLDGDARFSSYVLMRTTSSSGWNNLYLDYNTNTDDTITIDSTTVTFVINISGRSSVGDSAGFIIRGCAKKYSSTVSLVGSPIIESFLDSNFATANAQISTSGSGLIIQVDQGSSGVSGTVYWVANVQMSRITY